MNVGVVIVNHNQKDILDACLASWKKVRWPGLKILVSDNASVDGTREMLKNKYQTVTLLKHDPEIGFAAAANAGLEKLAGDCEYLFLTTNDTEVDPGILETLVAQAEREPRAAALGPKINYFDQRDRVWHAGGFVKTLTGNPGHYGWGQKDDGRFDQVRDCRFVTGCGVLLRVSACRPLGFFRGELAFYAEDSDLCARLREQGFVCRYVPTALMWHRVSLTLVEASPMQAYYATRNSLALLSRHRVGFVWPLNLFLYAAVVLLWRILRHSLRGRHSAARATLAGIRDWCLNRYGLVGDWT